jgi:hypothetical protein
LIKEFQLNSTLDNKTSKLNTQLNLSLQRSKYACEIFNRLEQKGMIDQVKMSSNTEKYLGIKKGSSLLTNLRDNDKFFG